MTHQIKEVINHRSGSLLNEQQYDVPKPLKLMINNKSTLNLTKNLISQERSNHIEIVFHFIREQVINRMLGVSYCPTKLQLANEFTKTLNIDKFVYLREQLGLMYV